MKTTTKIRARYAALAVAVTAVLGGGLAACTSQADSVSYDLSQQADSFKVNRQIVVLNDITGEYTAEVNGLCALGNDDGPNETSVICKIGPDKYVKELFRTGDNTTVSSLQVEPLDANPYSYRIILKPEQIIPQVEVQTSNQE